VDERTGLVSREWYRFFFNLFNLTGGGGNFTSLQDLLVSPPTVDTAAVLAAALDGLAVAPPAAGEPPGWALPPRTVDSEGFVGYILTETNDRLITENGDLIYATSGSPFTLQNTTGQSIDVIVAGGTDVDIYISRGGTTFYGVGLNTGVFWLSPYDRLLVAYATAPTLTLVPR
jgi:hypothetical protein